MKLNNKGFTLIEVLAVISIIVLLGLVTVPNALHSINNTKKSSYNILVENIKEASIRLYEEIYISGNTIYNYTKSGKGEKLIINNNSITFNLQTLVSNGLLKGANNKNKSVVSDNINSVVLLDPVTNSDMSGCTIEITRKKDTSGKVLYEIKELTDSAICPSSSDYGKLIDEESEEE